MMITKIDRAAPVMEPLPDPPEKTDMQQVRHYVAARSALGAYLGGRGDVLVAGYGYLIVSRESVEDWAEHFYPDCVVAFGVDPESIIDRNGYVISEVGKPPDFVLEIASKTTSSRDETVKLEGYANMMVPEYWMFDGSGKGYYSRVLSGYRLVGDAYRPIELTEEADGEVRGYSPALSLYLCADVENRLRFWDSATQEYLPTHKEAIDGQARAEAAREREWALRINAESAQEQERALRINAESARERERAARIEAEAEIERLRDRLRRTDLG
jgi:hypothetical protein